MKIPPETLGSQRTFRRLLDAAARPGIPLALPPAQRDPGVTVLLALLDPEVSFNTADREEAVRLSLLTGAAEADAREADFVLTRGGSLERTLGQMKRGTLQQPELGATLIHRVGWLSAEGAPSLRLTGPGVDGSRSLAVQGLRAGEVEALRESRECYPRGVDVYLVDDDGLVAGLPRSARLEASE